MYVCTYVCMYVCMCVCMYVICMYACMHVCMYACMHVCMYACMHVCMYACMDVWMYGCMDGCMYVCMYVICMLYVCMHGCIFVVCLYVCMYGLRRSPRRTVSCGCRRRSVSLQERLGSQAPRVGPRQACRVMLLITGPKQNDRVEQMPSALPHPQPQTLNHHYFCYEYGYC